MRYAGGRPLWHLSLVLWRNRQPARLSSLDGRDIRRLEAMRDQIMRGIGTDEPWVEEPGHIAINWRRPLRIEEINQLAPRDRFVRERPGRA